MSVAAIEEQNADDMTGIVKVIAVLTVVLGTFLITLDQFIVNVSISTIAGELGVSNNNGAWSITAYTTANAFAMPFTGWLTKRVGRVHLFATATAFFALFSFLCGAADTLGQLVFYRVLQGIAGGPLIPLSQSLLLFLMARQKAAAMGIFGMVVMLGPVAGPVLGGWITFDYGWRPIFYINVPIGLMLSVLTLILLTRYESPRNRDKLDWSGAALLFFWVAAYQVIMNKGYDWAWFESPKIVMLACVAGVSFIYWFIVQFFNENPLFEMRFFRSMNFTIAFVVMTPIMAIVFANLVVGPLWVQQVLGYTQLWAGFTLAPLGITALLIFPIVGRFLPVVDVRIWVALALLVFGASFMWIAYSPIDIDFRTMAYQRMLMGVGFAMIYPPLMAVSISDIAPRDMPSASAVFSFARMMGLGFGIAYGTNYYDTREVFFQQRYNSWVNPHNEAWVPYMESLKAMGIEGKQKIAETYTMVQYQAFTESYLQMCYISGLISFVLLLSLFFIKNPTEVGHAEVG